MNKVIDIELKTKIIDALKRVNDPETNLNVYDMDLIQALRVVNGNVSLKFEHSSNICPMAI